MFLLLFLSWGLNYNYYLNVCVLCYRPQFPGSQLPEQFLSYNLLLGRVLPTVWVQSCRSDAASRLLWLHAWTAHQPACRQRGPRGARRRPGETLRDSLLPERRWVLLSFLLIKILSSGSSYFTFVFVVVGGGVEGRLVKWIY